MQFFGKTVRSISLQFGFGAERLLGDLEPDHRLPFLSFNDGECKFARAGIVVRLEAPRHGVLLLADLLGDGRIITIDWIDQILFSMLTDPRARVFAEEAVERYCALVDPRLDHREVSALITQCIAEKR